MDRELVAHLLDALILGLVMLSVAWPWLSAGVIVLVAVRVWLVRG